MINRLLYRLTARLPCRLIYVNGKPYLERYALTRRIYLHRFVGTDGDRHQHNHPSNGLSIVLTGSYIEEVITDIGVDGPLTAERRVRWLNWIPSNRFHRIIAVSPRTWTLFITGPRIDGKGWGFFEPLLSDGETIATIFRPVSLTNPDWYKHAPRGADSDRQPL